MSLINLKEKLLVIGGSGLVGSTIISNTHNYYDIKFTYNKNKFVHPNIESFEVDLLDDRNIIANILEKFKPKYVIHTAAHPSVDLCETNPQLANKLHIDITNNIAKICSSLNSKLVYFSTDAVFDGLIKKKYTESDLPNPINYYGKTKLSAEKIILNESKDNVVLRTAVIYGLHKKSRFTNWIIDSLKEKKSVDPHVDQYNTPTLVDDLSKAVMQILLMNLSGLFHATGKTCVSRYEFACLIADIFNFEKSLIKPVTSLEKKQDAPRPKFTCLDSSLLETKIGFTFHDLDSGIRYIKGKSQNS